MLISIRDLDEDGIYTLDFSPEDALRLHNMRFMHQSQIDLPSIGGNANLSSDGALTIFYQNGRVNWHGSICADFDEVANTINETYPGGEEEDEDEDD